MFLGIVLPVPFKAEGLMIVGESDNMTDTIPFSRTPTRRFRPAFLKAVVLCEPSVAVNCSSHVSTYGFFRGS